MIVKAVLIGFYNRLRKPGEVFNIDAKECPKWCVEVARETPGKALDIKATEATVFIATLNNEDEIMAFIEGDDRVSVVKAAEERLAELKA